MHLNATAFLNNRVGWAIGSNDAILQTINGGRSCQTQRSGVPTDLFHVKFVNAGEGWAVGAECTVLHTRDCGANWISERSPIPNTLERIYFTDRNRGWAVGFGGTIIAYGPSDQPSRLRR